MGWPPRVRSNRSGATEAKRAAVLVLVFALLIGRPRSASASSALELVEIARAHERAHEEAIAVRRYMEALSLDPTCEKAYLGLGGLREREGDVREAERVYSVALEHLPGLREARTARAFVRRAQGATRDAVEDLLASPTDETESVRALRIVAGWYAEDGLVPAALAVWRRLAVRAELAGDAVLGREARTMSRALVLVVGPADPVAAPSDDRGLRRMLGVLARRGRLGSGG